MNSKDWTQERFGSFINPKATVEVSAYEWMHGDENKKQSLRDIMKHRVVIIGGDWHSRATRRGSKVDRHETPVGQLPGMVLHANFVEAILDDRAFDIPASKWLLGIADVLFGVLLAYALIFPVPSPHTKWKGILKIAAVVAVIAFPIFISFLLMEFFGVYWDAVLLSVLLVGHIVAERVIGWGHR
ncbi:MAG: CHASE2 domain-containing protein [Pirellulales bacterium]